ncbi:MAG: hypothetical protein WBV77_07670 [Solirubrobacteraceae bacterium]
MDYKVAHAIIPSPSLGSRKKGLEYYVESLKEVMKAKLVTAMSVALSIVVLCWMAGMKCRHAAALALVGAAFFG